MTALSYAQLVVLFPRSAGEAYYVNQGFQVSFLTKLVGYLVILTGIVSAATLANGFVGYFSSFLELPRFAVITVVVLIMGLIALWGIAESLWLAALITLIELGVGGLLLVVVLGGESLAEFPKQWQSLLIPSAYVELGMILSGAFLAFYAFIGFEDMVNVVEEVRQPQDTMPKAILLALMISSAMYFLVAVVALLGLPLDQLSASDAPLRDLLEVEHPLAGQLIGGISLFAIINGVLIQIIMASRVLYGMADQGSAPSVLANVWSVTRTPWLATLVVVALLLVFALWLPLVTLAKTTSFVILVIFTLVNIALWVLLRQERVEKAVRLPCWPIFGAMLCLGLLLFQLSSLLS